jgi:hypothetical protein
MVRASIQQQLLSIVYLLGMCEREGRNTTQVHWSFVMPMDEKF